MRELTVAKKALGIDIGSHSLKAVVATKRGASVAISSVVEVPLSRSRPAAEPEQLATAVDQLKERLKIGSSLVVSSISTHKTTVRNLEIPFSQEEKARQILKFQTEPYLAFPIEEVIIDFYNTQTAPAGKMKVLLTAIHKGVVGDHLTFLSGAGIDPEVVDVDFMAVANTALHAEPRLREGAATVLDVGATKTIACYIREGKLLAVRCIPLGGDDFSEAVCKELGVSFVEAERMKAEQGAAGDSAQDASERARAAIGSVLDRLGAELERTVRYFSSQAKGGSFDKVILCGGSASLPGLDKFLGETLSAEVTVISPSETIKNKSGEELAFPRFATAIGLALRGLGESLGLQNFRQEEHAYARPFRRLRKTLAISGALGASIAALLVFSLFEAQGRYRAERSQLYVDIETKRRTIFPKTARDLKHMETLLKEEEDKLTPFRELRRNISLLDVLDDISARVPKEMIVEVTLLNYNRLSPRRLTPVKGTRRPRTKSTASVGTITLHGTVSSDPEVVELKTVLNESPYFEVLDRGGTRKEASGRTRFQFDLELKETPS